MSEQPIVTPPRRILLGVTGGIAAYKACALVSRLVQRGDEVDVILTEETLRFVTALSFAALTRRRVWTSLWDEPEKIPHIALVRAAEVFVIAPATAQCLARLALGLADDLLGNAALAARIPLVVAPAMNTAMYEHSATQSHLEILRQRGVSIVEPEDGFLAEREHGRGRLASEERILAAIDDQVVRAQSLRGLRVLITAGPTREAIDPVRYLSNPATGATGIALAREAQKRGARVQLILGPTHLSPPANVDVTHVVSAKEMLAAALLHPTELPDLIIASAAVADERPVVTALQKQKKRDGGMSEIALTPTEDIVSHLRATFPTAFILGFAAETENHHANGQEKLYAKCLDAIAVNNVSHGQGFGVGENALTLLAPGYCCHLTQTTKTLLARQLFDTLEKLAPQLHQPDARKISQAPAVT